MNGAGNGIDARTGYQRGHIYLQKGILVAALPEGVYGISIITEIELRGFAGLTGEQRQWLQAFLDNIHIVGLDEDIK